MKRLEAASGNPRAPRRRELASTSPATGLVLVCALLCATTGSADAGGRHHGHGRHGGWHGGGHEMPRQQAPTPSPAASPPIVAPAGVPLPPAPTMPSAPQAQAPTAAAPSAPAATAPDTPAGAPSGPRPAGAAPAAALAGPPATLLEAWKRLTAPAPHHQHGSAHHGNAHHGPSHQHQHHSHGHRGHDHRSPPVSAKELPATLKAAAAAAMAAPAAAAVKAPANVAPSAAPQPAAAPSIPPPQPAAQAQAYASPAIPPLAPHSPHEVLALDLPADTIAALQHLGFGIGAPRTNTLLGRTITPVSTPQGMDAAAAQTMLRSLMPGTTVALNTVYRPPAYQAATQEPHAGAPRGQKAAAGPCPPDRCYGGGAIGWKPQLGACAQRLKIGIIDTAIERAHPAFDSRRITEAQVNPQGARRPAPQWHGTGIVSVLAGAPGSGTPGLIPEADFFVADIFFADSGGNAISDSASMLQALDLMDSFGVRIVNMSVSGSRDELVERAVLRLAGKGVVIVAAAGNGGPDAGPSYPAAYPQAIAVTAVNRDRLGYRHANRGAYIDVAAPGVDIWTALPGELEGSQTGTSFAVPYVTAIVAAIYGQSPQKTKAALLGLITTSDLGAPGRDPIYGRGLVQAPASCKPAPPAPATPPAQTVRAFDPPVVSPAAFGLGPSGGL